MPFVSHVKQNEQRWNSYLIRSMIDNKVHYELHATLFELFDQMINIIQCPIRTMDITVVRLKPS